MRAHAPAERLDAVGTVHDSFCAARSVGRGPISADDHLRISCW